MSVWSIIITFEFALAFALIALHLIGKLPPPNAKAKLSTPQYA